MIESIKVDPEVGSGWLRLRTRLRQIELRQGYECTGVSVPKFAFVAGAMPWS